MSSHDTTGTGTAGTTDRGRTVPQWGSLVVGALFTLIGLAGFAVTGFDGWTEHDPDQTLLGFAVNPLHNVVHLVIGVAGLALAARDGSARLYGWLLALGYGVTLVYGLFVAGQEDGNFLNINAADNVLHAVSIAAGLAIALWPRRKHDDDRRTTRH